MAEEQLTLFDSAGELHVQGECGPEASQDERTRVAVCNFDGYNRQIRLDAIVLRAELLRLAIRGVNATKAARLMGITKDQSRRIYAEPEFRRQVREKVEGVFSDIDEAYAYKKKSLHERLAEVGERAFDELVALLEAGDTPKTLRVKIAQDFLDRNPESQSGQIVRHEKFDPSQLAIASQAAREMEEALRAKVIPIKKTGT